MLRKLQRLSICAAWVGLGLGTALILSGCGDGTPTKEVEIVRPVRTFQVYDAEDVHNRYFIGTARAAREVSLAFAVSGTLTGIRVAVGDQVEKGQIIATLDPATYQAEVNRLAADPTGRCRSGSTLRRRTTRGRSASIRPKTTPGRLPESPPRDGKSWARWPSSSRPTGDHSA